MQKRDSDASAFARVAQPLGGARLFILPGAMEPAVCLRYIDASETSGWCATNIGELNPSYSRSQSWIEIDTGTIFCAIREFAPPVLDGMEIAMLEAQRTQCMKYAQGEHFGIHTDSPFFGQDGSLTKLSLVLYLNDDFSGGETSFPDLEIEVTPETGKVILFAPDLRHQSKTVAKGMKYIIRSEVLYKPKRSRTAPNL